MEPDELIDAIGDSGPVLLGARELKQLLAHSGLPRDIDPLAIEDYMTWGYVPEGRSILRGVEKLAAGHYRLLRHTAAPAASVQWWDVSFADRACGSADALGEELLQHLHEAVTSRMAADVPLGARRAAGRQSGVAARGGRRALGERRPALRFR